MPSYCKNCKRETRGTTFCHVCDSDKPQTLLNSRKTQSARCPKCKSLVIENQYSCDDCGYILQKAY